MPKALEEKLKRGAAKTGLRGKRKAAYVYGTMNKLGLMRGNKVTAKGRAAERKTQAEGG